MAYLLAGTVEAEALPSERVMLSRSSSVLWPHPTSHTTSPRTSRNCAYTGTYRRQARIHLSQTGNFHRPTGVHRSQTADRMRSPLLHCLLSRHSASLTPTGSLRLHFLNYTSSMTFAFLRKAQHPFFPLVEGLVTTLQNSLYVTDCRFAHPSRVDIPLRHNRSPGSIGNLLPDSQAIIGTGLSPASKQYLARHTGERQEEAGTGVEGSVAGRYSKKIL